MSVGMFFTLIAISLFVSGFSGIFIGRKIAELLEAKKGYTTVSMKQLVNLVEERNAYRYALKHGISLEEVEQAISEDGK